MSCLARFGPCEDLRAARHTLALGASARVGATSNTWNKCCKSALVACMHPPHFEQVVTTIVFYDTTDFVGHSGMLYPWDATYGKFCFEVSQGLTRSQF